MNQQIANLLRAIALVLLGLIGSIPNVHARDRDDIETTGDVLAYLLPATAATATLWEEGHEGTVQFSESFGVAMGTAVILKYAVREERPNKRNDYSFPSGHSASSFASAEFIRVRYGWKYGIPAYLSAAFVGYSRVHAEQHHTHDVLAGASIGVLSSHFFTTTYKGMQLQVGSDLHSHFIGLNKSW